MIGGPRCANKLDFIFSKNGPFQIVDNIFRATSHRSQEP